MTWLPLALFLFAEPAGETLAPVTPNGIVRQVLQNQPIASNHCLVIEMRRTFHDGRESEPVTFAIAWNEEWDYEIRLHGEDGIPPLVSCRGNVCVADGQHAFERGWLEARTIDYEALPASPQFDPDLEFVRETINLIFKQVLFPLHTFTNPRIESIWLHNRNTMLNDEEPDSDVFIILSEAADLLGKSLQPEGLIHMNHHLHVDRQNMRLVRMETFFDDELVIDARWEWGEPSSAGEDAGYGLRRAAVAYFEQGYEEAVRFEVLADSPIAPDEVFADSSIFELSGEPVPWQEPRRAISYWMILGRILPILPLILVGTLILLILFLLKRVRTRAAQARAEAAP